MEKLDFSKHLNIKNRSILVHIVTLLRWIYLSFGESGSHFDGSNIFIFHEQICCSSNHPPRIGSETLLSGYEQWRLNPANTSQGERPFLWKWHADSVFENCDIQVSIVTSKYYNKTDVEIWGSRMKGIWKFLEKMPSNKYDNVGRSIRRCTLFSSKAALVKYNAIRISEATTDRIEGKLKDCLQHVCTYLHCPTLFTPL